MKTALIFDWGDTVMRDFPDIKGPMAEWKHVDFFTSKDLGFEKPDIRFFEKIIEKIQVDSSNCIMIGNVYEKDIVGAKAIGMKTIFFNENQVKGDYKDANTVIFSMKDLCKVISQIIKVR